MNPRTVVLYGNCQAQFLHHVLASAPSLAAQHRFVLVTPKISPDAPVEDLPEGLDAATLLWEQYDRRDDVSMRDRMRAALPDDLEVVTFPAIGSEAMWPLRRRCPRNVPEPGYVWGRYPLSDAVIEEIADQGASGEDAYALYLERSRTAMPDPERLLDVDRYFQAKRDAECDVKMGDAVFDDVVYRTRYQFWTYSHLATDVILTLLHRLIARSSRFARPDASARAAFQAFLDQTPGQGDFQQPIHPAVAERLGLRFVDADSRYRWFGQAWTFEQYVRKLIALDRSW